MTVGNSSKVREHCQRGKAPLFRASLSTTPSTPPNGSALPLPPLPHKGGAFFKVSILPYVNVFMHSLFITCMYSCSHAFMHSCLSLHLLLHAFLHACISMFVWLAVSLSGLFAFSFFVFFVIQAICCHCYRYFW